MPNRLAGESSPYLKQHADNPVDWHPWDEQALDLARSRDRPILLSIGYSACHWCHVMERESFSDPELAEVMNRSFVNIKVDREERPDLDAVYMRAVQSLTGRGGWPLTVFLTPEGRPFYGGTYFPPEPRHGMPSFGQVLEATNQAWRDRRDDVEAAAGEITDLLQRASREPSVGEGEEDTAALPLDAPLLEKAVRRLLAQYDPNHGGFGQAPKFPQPSVIEFLLACHAGSGSERGDPIETNGRDEPGALHAAVHTLRRMARGGIRDHLGGGFHRYSVDVRWLVPHFEKMLYDNALLATAYLRAHQLTGDLEMEEVVRDTLDYLLTDLRSPDGAFFAARDADSEGEEGRFYVWTRDEVDALLSSEEARLFRRAYDVSASGNFEGRNILHLPRDLDDVARGAEISRDELDRSLEASRRILLDARSKRVAPLRDSKILAGWNGLALRALAEAGAALDEPRYVEAALHGLDFLLKALRPDGRLLHQVPDDQGRGIPAFLEDVTALGHACLSCHEATLDPRWLREAVDLADEVETRFRDESGLLFDTPHDAEPLVVRPREVTDSAVPSGSSLAAELFLRVGRLLGREERVGAARELVEAQGQALPKFPAGFGKLLQVAHDLVHPSLEIALVGGAAGQDGLDALLREAHRPFIPGRVVTGRRTPASEDDPGEAWPDTPLLEGRKALNGRATAYVCRAYACQAPVTTPAELRDQLAAAGGPPSDE